MSRGIRHPLPVSMKNICIHLLQSSRHLLQALSSLNIAIAEGNHEDPQLAIARQWVDLHHEQWAAFDKLVAEDIAADVHTTVEDGNQVNGGHLDQSKTGNEVSTSSSTRKRGCPSMSEDNGTEHCEESDEDGNQHDKKRLKRSSDEDEPPPDSDEETEEDQQEEDSDEEEDDETLSPLVQQEPEYDGGDENETDDDSDDNQSTSSSNLNTLPHPPVVTPTTQRSSWLAIVLNGPVGSVQHDVAKHL